MESVLDFIAWAWIGIAMTGLFFIQGKDRKYNRGLGTALACLLVLRILYHFGFVVIMRVPN